MEKTITFLFLFIFSGTICLGQTCTHPGQTPESAINLCGSATIIMNVPTRCGQTPVPIPCGDGYPYSNKNPVFFKILCFGSGTLGFNITPIDLNANFSWALFNVTNTNPADIFTNPNLLLACNWSATLGVTGASIDGNDLIVCSGGSQNPFSKMPDLVRGMTYILMVVDEPGSSEPFQLSVENGSASITDPVEPALQNASLSCDGTRLIVKFNKQMLCRTVSGDGSDFQLTGPANIIGAVTGDCNNVVGSDSVYLTIDRPLPYGTYTLSMANGSDGNTVSDPCNRFIPDRQSLNFTVSAANPTMMDSIKPVGCSPGFLELVFKKPIQCSSLSSDGSDLFISGPQSLQLTPQCPWGDKKNIIRFDLSPSNITPGQYQIHLVKGSDGNSLIDQCGMETPPAILNFEIKEFVVADFNFSIPPTCGKTSVSFSHDGAHNVNQWNWNFGVGLSSALQNPTILFQQPGDHRVTLQVTNGICTDTSSALIHTDPPLQINFKLPAVICAGDTVKLENLSTGAIDQWRWEFGNGNGSTLKDPPSFVYPAPGYTALFTVTLVAQNSTLNCEVRLARTIQVLNDCQIRVPSAFSPNGDGLNDYFSPLQALKAKQLFFRIYDRHGQLVFISRDWTKKWDGKFKGRTMDTGVYVWLLEYIDPETAVQVSRKGTVSLIR